MTGDYQRGFMDGETEAWRQRDYPLPVRPPVLSEYQRGYWDARLPRSESWHRRVRVAQVWRSAA